MRRFFVVAVCLLTGAAGCHMCASPYDYCSPVIENYSGPNAGPTDDPEYAAHNTSGGQQMANAASGPRMASQQAAQGDMR